MLAIRREHALLHGTPVQVALQPGVDIGSNVGVFQSRPLVPLYPVQRRERHMPRTVSCMRVYCYDRSRSLTRDTH